MFHKDSIHSFSIAEKMFAKSKLCTNFVSEIVSDYGKTTTNIKNIKTLLNRIFILKNDAQKHVI